MTTAAALPRVAPDRWQDVCRRLADTGRRDEGSSDSLKYVVAIVPGVALAEITHALADREIYRLTVSEVEVLADDEETAAGSAESATSTGAREFGGVPDVDDRRCLRLEVAVNDAFLEPTLNALEEVGERHSPTWIQVFDLEQALRIRTGETGGEAI